MPRILSLLFTLLTTTSFAAEIVKPPQEWIDAGEKRRDQIPLGGKFKTDPNDLLQP